MGRTNLVPLAAFLAPLDHASASGGLVPTNQAFTPDTDHFPQTNVNPGQVKAIYRESVALRT